MSVFLISGGCGKKGEPNDPKKAKPAFLQRSAWEDVSQNLRVYLDASSSSAPVNKSFVLTFKASNIGKDPITLDAAPPIHNDCRLIFIGPNGKKHILQQVVPRTYRLIIQPGETRQWSMISNHWVDTWTADFKSKKWTRGQAPGVYTIFWRLNNALSNTVSVELKEKG